MKHLFLPYALAVLAKEKGFNDRCIGIIFPDGEVSPGSPVFTEIMLKRCPDAIKAPMYQQVVDWFREKFKIEVTVRCRNDRDWLMAFNGTIQNGQDFTTLNTVESYYEALDKAIEEAFKLI